jgi:hypothetical protein
MAELFVLGGLLVAGALIVAVLGLVFSLLKFAFWLLFLPVRLAFKLLALPFLLLKWLLVGVVGLFAVPILLVIAVVGGIALVVSLLAPLLPFALVAFLVWALFRMARRPATA